MIDPSSAVQLIGSAAMGCAAVGGAVLGVRAKIAAFRYLREAGLSVSESFAGVGGMSAEERQAGKDYEYGDGITPEQRQAEKEQEVSDGVSAEGRQMEKDYEAMWAEKERNG